MSHDTSTFEVVLVGLGRVARKHLKAFKEWPDRLRLAAAVDRNEDSARETLQAAGFSAAESEAVPFFSSLSEALAGLPSRPQIAALTTPSGTHYELAQEALLAGCHVLIEKPMTLDLAEGRRLLALSREKGLKIAVGHIYRFFPLVDLLQKEIADGLFGEVLQAEVNVHWGHDQAYYDQAEWRGTWTSDGGVLMNQTVHALDLMTWLLGLELVSVNGRIARLAHDMEAEDYGAALITLSNSSILRVEGTTNTPPEAHAASFTILTDKGEIKAGLRSGRPYFSIRDRSGKKIRRSYLRRFLRQARERGGLFKGIKTYLNPHTGIYLDLLDAITNDRSPRADGMAGYSAVEQILAIYRSAREGGCEVTLPLQDDRLLDMEGFFS